MIDENKIIVSKLLRQARDIQEKYRMSGNDMEYLLTLLIGLFCIRFQYSITSRHLPESFLENLIKFIKDCDPGSSSYSPNTFYTILNELGHHLEVDRKHRVPVFEEGAIAHATQLISRSLDLHLSNPPDNLIGIFENLYRNLIGQTYEDEFRNSERFSHLTKAFKRDNIPVWEYFPTFGDVSIGQGLNDRNGIAYGSVFPRHELLLHLRLWLHGVRLHHLQDDIEPFMFGFINHPDQRITDMSLFGQRLAAPTSALSALAKIWDRHQWFGYALVVIPGIDRSAAGKRASFRKELTISRRLTTVIDLPYLSKAGNKKNSVSIWVIVDAPIRTETILCVDATKLPQREFSTDRLQHDMAEMNFVSAIVKTWLHSIGEADIPSPLSNENTFSTLYKRLFGSGYTDIPGLCRAVSSNEIADSNYILRASTYVLQINQEKEWLSSIDSSPILSKFSDHSNEKFRAYVIGNNGTGKSLLLRELVHHLKHREIRSVGISFGTTDRFPFTGKSATNAMFVYRGARTGTAGLNFTTAATQLAALTKAIHVNQEKLDVFDETMEVLGFRRRHYLVPMGFLDVNGEFTNAQLEELIELTNEANENSRVLADAGKKQHQLGLMRISDKNRVVVFDTLSSGEQQILTLVIKLVAEVMPGTVALVDEPEISLHVAWQRMLPDILRRIGTKLDCSMVVATHSPVIIASATNEGDYCYTAKDGALTPISSKRSQSVETVLFDDFETYTANNRRVHERCARIVSDVIAALNSNEAGHMEQIEQIRNELKEMSAIINASSSLESQSQKSTDLELIHKADLAIREILDMAANDQSVEASE